MSDTLISVQVAPWAILNEGVDHALDFLCENGVNGLHLNTHTYYGGGDGNRNNLYCWAPDHCQTDENKLWDGPSSGVAWIQHNPERYREAGVFHHYGDNGPGSAEFDAIAEGARRRGMRVYARYLDGWESNRMKNIDGWEGLLSVGPDGEQLRIPCLTNPRLREWSRLTMEDIAAREDLAGVLYGIERGTPLEDVLYMGALPHCFCHHCEEAARRRGFDFERAKEGFRKLKAWSDQFRNDPDFIPNEDPCTWLNEHYQAFPEIWAFNQMQTEAMHEVEKLAFEAYRKAKPDGDFAALTHPNSTALSGLNHDPRFHIGHCDTLAIRMYEHIHGARMINTLRERDPQRFTRCYSEPFRWEMAWRAYAGSTFPVPENPDDVLEGGIPAAVGVERARRQIAQYRNEFAFQALVGVDITHPFPERRVTPPEYVEEICRGAIEAGARDIILCREYQEISGQAMRAARRAADAAV